MDAGAGTRYEIAFLGRDELEGQDLTLTATSSDTDTSDERRTLLVDRFEVELVRYVADTPTGDLLDIEYADPSAAEGAETPEPTTDPDQDPWNLWVFTVRLGGSLSGESLFNSSSVNGSLSANRTSESWKLRIGTNTSYSEDEFEVGDETIVSFRRSMGTDLLVVRSAGPHWGFGGRSSVTSSTFQNYDMRVSAQPAVEYNLFPYEESSRRSFTFQYRIGPQYVRYDEETVFNQLEETIWENSLTGSLGLRQPWGSANLSLSGSAFVDDWEKNEISIFGNLNFRIVRGLSLFVFGSASRVRNRINIPLRDATEDEVLLRRRILETDFSYRINFNISYTFGSIFNNIVNPRFESGGGGFFF